MKRSPNLLSIALVVLGVALLVCLGGIIWLASANPARAIPDILVGTTTLIVGAIVGVLVPTKTPDVAAPDTTPFTGSHGERRDPHTGRFISDHESGPETTPFTGSH